VLHFVLLVVCALAIYLSCEWFVNAVEWLGRRMAVGATAVGSVLAAIGTALPESVVTFVAVVFSTSPAQKDIGVGAAMGGPLALATIAYGIIGLTLLATRRVPDPREWGDLDKLTRDQTWFLAVFVVKVALGLVTFALKPWLGLLFFAAYAVYFWREMRAEDDDEPDELEPLKLQRGREQPGTPAVVVQTVVSLAIIFVASQLFVRQLDEVGPLLGLPASVTALLLSPVATELPETMNAVIWVRQGKTKLALANVSGSMMIQATIPSGLGILFTPWLFDRPLLVSGVVTMAAITYLLIMLRSRRLTVARLSAVAVFYVLFALALIPMVT
jgi:cation:H+ antiporter